MGSCAYFIKADYPTISDAQKALPQIRAFIKWMRKAHKDPRTTLKLEKEDMTQLQQFQTETFDVGDGEYGKDSKVENLQRNGNVISYYDNDVGHMTSWGPFAKYLKDHGACRAVWNNEENSVFSLDNLQLYDWEGIVQDLLKQKKILPTLLGINEDLDTLIERTFHECKKKKIPD